MMVFMPLVMVLIGQFCNDVIGCGDLKVAVIGWFSCFIVKFQSINFKVCRFCLRSCMSCFYNDCR